MCVPLEREWFARCFAFSSSSAVRLVQTAMNAAAVRATAASSESFDRPDTRLTPEFESLIFFLAENPDVETWEDAVPQVDKTPIRRVAPDAVLDGCLVRAPGKKGVLPTFGLPALRSA